MRALLLLLCLQSSFASDVRKRPLVEFRGNVLFDDFLYRSVLDLPESARATPAEAQAVSAKLLGFLQRAGYDLAVVRAKVQGEQIMVEIDEGRLDKISSRSTPTWAWDGNQSVQRISRPRSYCGRYSSSGTGVARQQGSLAT